MLFQLFLVFVAWLAYIYYKAWKKMSYFRSIGVEEDPGYFPLGSEDMWNLSLGKNAFNDMFQKGYARFYGKRMYGHYGMMGIPHFVMQDMDLVKDVLIKDFDHFVDRREFSFGENKYLNNMLTVLTGEQWKTMRTMLTPIFTSGKLKGMVKLIDKVGDSMVNHLEKFAEDGIEFETKELFTLYGVDVVASTGFGFEAKAFSDPNSIFKDQVDQLTFIGKYKRKGLAQFKVVFMVLFPQLAKFFKVEFFEASNLKFFINIIKSTIEDRRKSGHHRNDFIDCMLQGFQAATNQMNKPETSSESQFDKDAELKTNSLPAIGGFQSKEAMEDAVVSNAFVMFFAGFDTSSTSMAITAYFLAKNPDVQDQLYEEIREAIEANNNSQYLEYQHIQSLPFLEGCIMEAMRLYPLTNLERKCTKDYTIRGTNVTIKKGTLVQIPSAEMMKDPKYWDNPDTYDPSRFNEEDNARRGQYHYLVFGHGPRNCIGKRFALLQSKTGIFRLIANYKLITCERTVDKLVADPASTSQQPKGGMWIKCVKRESV